MSRETIFREPYDPEQFREPWLQCIGFKPRGLWYGVDGDWERWCQSEQLDWITDHRFALEIDDSRVLKLTNMSALQEFTAEYYSIDKVWGSRYQQIDWPRLTGLYSGIEISPYQWNGRHSLGWYYPWGCASGCVWDKSIIRSFTRIETPHRKERVAPNILQGDQL